MITAEDVITTCGKRPELLALSHGRDDIQQNAHTTARLVTRILVLFGQSRMLTSGWRTPEINADARGRPKSHHLTASAADVEDADGSLAKWCLGNLPKLKEVGLWVESPTYTPGWVHFQIVPPRSKSRVFIP